MKCSVVGFVALLIFPIQATADHITLGYGRYVANFPDGCGQLIIRDGGRKLDYVYADTCGTKPKGVRYRATSVNLVGDVIRVDDATLSLTKVSSNSLSGKWTLGNFRRI